MIYGKKLIQLFYLYIYVGANKFIWGYIVPASIGTGFSLPGNLDTYKQWIIIKYAVNKVSKNSVFKETATWTRGWHLGNSQFIFQNRIFMGIPYIDINLWRAIWGLLLLIVTTITVWSQSQSVKHTSNSAHFNICFLARWDFDYILNDFVFLITTLTGVLGLSIFCQHSEGENFQSDKSSLVSTFRNSFPSFYK